MIDPLNNIALQNDIKKILNKDQCMDIFKDVNFNEFRKDKTVLNHSNYIKYKFKKKARLLALEQMNLLLNFRFISGISLLFGILKKIRISKELLTIDLEQGSMMLIPKLLR
jgi:hypothetical protein